MHGTVLSGSWGLPHYARHSISQGPDTHLERVQNTGQLLWDLWDTFHPPWGTQIQLSVSLCFTTLLLFSEVLSSPDKVIQVSTKS